ncbi:MAG: diguanylate cyclase [Hydrogenophilales bacterium]|nr:diguanylate cyclase [Hydrogenophilales bacterium]
MDIYQRIFEYTPDALFVTDQAGHIVLANAQTETLFGYDRSELIGQPVEMLVPPRFAAHHAGHRTRFTSEAHSRPMGKAAELFALRRDGSEFPVDIMLSPMILHGAHFVLCVIRDITERKAAQDELARQTAELRRLHAELELLANHDGLTGLYNWRAFYEYAGQMLKTAHRRQENATLLMIDLDHFKQINDRFGHAEGDRVLQAVASTLKATARENDIVARHGGEEFVVAALGLNEAESLVAAERLRAAVAATENMKTRITASIGIATLAPQAQKHETPRLLAELLDQADQALYTAKRNGRNQVCHFSRLADPAEAESPQMKTPIISS